MRVVGGGREAGGTPGGRLERLIESGLQEPEMDELWRVHIAFEPEVGFDLQLREAAFQANQKWDELIAATVREGIATGQLAACAK